MHRRFKHLFWIIPTGALLGWATVHQLVAPATLGQKMDSTLRFTRLAARLRSAEPLVEYQPMGPAASVPLTKAAASRASEDFWEAPGVRLSRTLRQRPALRTALTDAVLSAAMEDAWGLLGLEARAGQIVGATRVDILSHTDQEILEQVIRADDADLQRGDDPLTVTRSAMLLLCAPITGPAGYIEIPAGGRLYAVQADESTHSPTWRLELFRFDAAGAELWHGVLILDRKAGTEPQAMAVLWAALKQMEPLDMTTEPATRP